MIEDHIWECIRPSLFHVSFPENTNENYNHETWELIKDHPRKWLASLPMWEYAYVLVVICATQRGGTLDKYIDDLYKQRMNPILKAYYDRLVVYRIHRAILMRKYESMKNVLTDTSVAQELEEMRKYTIKTRRALRSVVKDFTDQLEGLRDGPRAVEDTLPECFPLAEDSE